MRRRPVTWSRWISGFGDGVFANFAEALAEARGKAQAEALRKTRRETPAFRFRQDGSLEETVSTNLRAGDRVVVTAGQIIPGDGEIIEGVAAVDESADHRRIGACHPRGGRRSLRRHRGHDGPFGPDRRRSHCRARAARSSIA